MEAEIVKYPIPGAEDTVGEVATAEARATLDDFYRSGVLDRTSSAYASNAARADLIADQGVLVSARFGVGERLTKAERGLDRQAQHIRKEHHKHDQIRMVALGANTVVLSGRSTSRLSVGDKVSNVPRVFLQVWVKLDGRWQQAVHSVADIPYGTTRGFE